MDYNLQNDINPKLNAFDLAHNHFTTMSMGKLYPIAWFECVPGDIYDLDLQALVRVQPMIAPILNNLTCDIHAFFVPTRLLWKEWEDFITTIKQDSIPPESYEGSPPVWLQHDNSPDEALKDIDTSSESLWDMFGLSRIFNTKALKEYRPVDFLRRSYYFIWNEWFRDENLQEPIDYYNSDRQDLLYRAWKKDYFTAGYISRQKGKSPSVPLTGTGKVDFNSTLNLTRYRNSLLDYYDHLSGDWTNNTVTLNQPNSNGFYPSTDNQAYYYNNNVERIFNNGFLGYSVPFNQLNEPIMNYLKDNSFDMSNVGTFDTNDLREMFQIQKFLERLMMSGSRYIEFLQSQFGVSPSDSRLQIPERIGGTSFNIQISEVLQTSAPTDVSPQGNQSGHGLSVAEGNIGNYKCVEFGYIILLANIQPPAVYVDRMPRELYRKSLLEQFNPHFVNLSFQAVSRREIYAQGTAQDDEIFNYDGRYDEMREKMSYVSGDLYDKLEYYLNFRKFESAPAFNSEFIECKPSASIFAVQDESPFICNFWLNVKALRPLPLVSEPGLIDHVYGGL